MDSAFWQAVTAISVIVLTVGFIIGIVKYLQFRRRDDAKLAIETLGGPTAIRCWYRLMPYLRQETERRGFYCDSFEDFTRRSLTHFRERGIPIWFNWGSDRIELVSLLQKPEFKPRTMEEIRSGIKPGTKV